KREYGVSVQSLTCRRVIREQPRLLHRFASRLPLAQRRDAFHETSVRQTELQRRITRRLRDHIPAGEAGFYVTEQRTEIVFLLFDPIAMQRETLRAVDVAVEPKQPRELEHERMQYARVTAAGVFVLDANHARPRISSEQRLRPARIRERVRRDRNAKREQQE